MTRCFSGSQRETEQLDLLTLRDLFNSSCCCIAQWDVGAVNSQTRVSAWWCIAGRRLVGKLHVGGSTWIMLRCPWGCKTALLLLSPLKGCSNAYFAPPKSPQWSRKVNFVISCIVASLISHVISSLLCVGQLKWKIIATLLRLSNLLTFSRGRDE